MKSAYCYAWHKLKCSSSTLISADFVTHTQQTVFDLYFYNTGFQC